MERDYHLCPIPRGVLGELSKIQEEVAELADAEKQGARVLILCELADLTGAVRLYLQQYFPGFEMQDLIDMADCTARSLNSGKRT